MAEVRIDLTREDAKVLSRLITKTAEIGQEPSGRARRVICLLIDAIREQVPEPKRRYQIKNAYGAPLGAWHLLDKGEVIGEIALLPDAVRIAKLLNAAEAKS